MEIYHACIDYDDVLCLTWRAKVVSSNLELFSNKLEFSFDYADDFSTYLSF